MSRNTREQLALLFVAVSIVLGIFAYMVYTNEKEIKYVIQQDYNVIHDAIELDALIRPYSKNYIVDFECLNCDFYATKLYQIYEGSNRAFLQPNVWFAAHEQTYTYQVRVRLYKNNDPIGARTILIRYRDGEYQQVYQTRAILDVLAH